MKKGLLPKQEYELIKVCMQGVEYGTAYTCSDCGRVIFNFAEIRGKMDGKTYIVGLTCVKKLLNKTLYFDTPTLWEYEKRCSEWKNAMNARKWVEKKQKERENKGLQKYTLLYKEIFDKNEKATFCYLELNDNTQKFPYQGHTAMIETKYKSVFNGLY